MSYSGNQFSLNYLRTHDDMALGKDLPGSPEFRRRIFSQTIPARKSLKMLPAFIGKKASDDTFRARTFSD